MSLSEDPASLVTRMEIIDVVEGAFAGPPVTVEDLLDEAVNHGARPQVLDQLHRLPARSFRAPVELWTHLPDLPVDH